MNSLSTLISVKEICEEKIEVKKSVFIARIYPVSTEEEAKKVIEENKKIYKDATHNVPAYRVYDEEKNMIIEKCSDDGEPQGTSGKPILDLLRHKDLLNTLIIVTRYFGGTLLGTGGLVKAYTDSAKKVIESSKQVTKVKMIHYKITTSYDSLNKIKKRFEDLNFELKNITYNIDVNFDLYLCDNETNLSNLQSILNENEETLIAREIEKCFI